MALKLHHLLQSRSQRIVWLIEELGAPVEIITHHRNPETRLAPPELKQVHPLGKSPLLETDDGVIAETGAIAEYLLAKFDPEHKLHPRADEPSFPAYLEWLHSAEGAPFLPGLIGFYLMNAELGETGLAQHMEGERAAAIAHVEGHLARNTYFAGEAFTAADCLMGFMVQTLAMSGVIDQLPAIKAWHERVSARPAFQRMLDIGI